MSSLVFRSQGSSDPAGRSLSPPPNRIYPAGMPSFPPTADNNYPSDRRDLYPSDNRPPWQRNRGDFIPDQESNVGSGPWSQIQGPQSDSYQKTPQVRQEMFGNERSGNYTDTGGTDRRQPIDQRRPQMMERDNRGGGGLVQYPDVNDYRSSGNRNNVPAVRTIEPLIRPQVQSERFGGPAQSRDWSNRPGRPDRPHWSDKSQDLCRNDNPARHQDWTERPQEQTCLPVPSRGLGRNVPDQVENQGRNDEWMNRSQREFNYPEVNRQEAAWRNRTRPDMNTGRPYSREKEEFDQRDRLMEDRNNRNRFMEAGDRNRFLDTEDRRLGNRFTETGGRSLGTRFTQPAERRFQEQNFTRKLPGLFDVNPQRDFGRKRERSPERQTVWNRLDISRASDISISRNKIPRLEDQFTGGSGRDAPFVRNQSSGLLEPSPSVNPLFKGGNKQAEGQGQVVMNAFLERNPYRVFFFCRNRKPSFLAKDVTQLRQKLLEELYSLARTLDIEGVPQLRFKSIGMVNRFKIAVDCFDAATTKWLLHWIPKQTRLELVASLPNDPFMLGLISFMVRGHFEIPLEELTTVLAVQNLGLEVSNWTNGRMRRTKKGRTYFFRVDGHTLRYLVENKSELFFGMQKLYVKRIKTNFVYSPFALAPY